MSRLCINWSVASEVTMTVIAPKTIDRMLFPRLREARREEFEAMSGAGRVRQTRLQ